MKPRESDSKVIESRECCETSGSGSADTIADGTQATAVAHAIPPAPRKDWNQGTTIQGRYRIVRRIGAGGMGAVYLAEQISIRRPIAIKKLKPELTNDPAFAERFRQEARNAAAVEGPRVVAVHDFGTADDGSPFIAMEYARGCTLKSLLRRTGRLPLRRALNFAIQLAEALGSVHRAGIIHRDVKPDNIIIGEGDELKLTDFGIAKPIDPSKRLALTRPDQLIGTPLYMAPEQLSCGDVDVRTDVYSWALVFSEMLLGATCDARSADHRSYGLPPAVSDLLTRCVAPEPGLRPHDMAGVLRELRAARRKMTWRRGARSRRPEKPSLAKPRAWVMAAVAALLIALAATVIEASAERGAARKSSPGLEPMEVPASDTDHRFATFSSNRQTVEHACSPASVRWSLAPVGTH